MIADNGLCCMTVDLSKDECDASTWQDFINISF